MVPNHPFGRRLTGMYGNYPKGETTWNLQLQWNIIEISSSAKWSEQEANSTSCRFVEGFFLIFWGGGGMSIFLLVPPSSHNIRGKDSFGLSGQRWTLACHTWTMGWWWAQICCFWLVDLHSNLQSHWRLKPFHIEDVSFLIHFTGSQQEWKERACSWPNLLSWNVEIAAAKLSMNGRIMAKKTVATHPRRGATRWRPEEPESVIWNEN